MKAFLTFFFSISLVGFAQLSQAASAVDFDFKVSRWQADYSGDIGSNGQTASLSELGFDDEDQNVIALELRHSLPILPNILIQNTDLDADASGTLVRTLEFNGVSFVSNTDVETELDLSHTDITLFYSPIDTWLTLDVGLTVRYFGEDTVVSSNILQSDVELDQFIPMAYLGVGVELPLTGFYIDASINGVSYEGSRFTDASLLIGYQASISKGVDIIAELGYRDLSVDIDDLDGFDGDIQIDGAYFTLGVSF